MREDAPPPRSGESLCPAVPDLSVSMELVQRAQGGDQDALNDLLRRYEPRLRRIVRVRMGARLRSRLEAEDIVQEVLLVAARKLGMLELRSHDSILQWFSRIALNEIRTKYGFFGAQKRDVDRVVPLRDASTSGPGVWVAARDTSPPQAVRRTELEALIDGYLEGLEPEDYREVILQRDYYEASWEEVRERLGRPTVHSVQELYRRALEKLRERLRPYLEP